MPWDEGKRPYTKAMMIFLAQWARRLRKSVSDCLLNFLASCFMPIKYGRNNS